MNKVGRQSLKQALDTITVVEGRRESVGHAKAQCDSVLASILQKASLRRKPKNMMQPQSCSF
jgi:hypothetical protein